MVRSDSVKLAVFDLDGTLLDSALSIVAGVRACWAACGFPEPDPVTVERIIGLPWEESVRALLPGAGEAEFAMIHNYHDEVARGVRRRPPCSEELFPGAREMLDTLEASGYLLAIITSRGARRLSEILDAEEIAGRFVSLKTTDHGPGKPSPELMLQTLAETGARPEEAVMVGDTTFDIEMARGAGTASVGVGWGVHEGDELMRAGADRVVAAFDEIPAAVHGLIGGPRGGAHGGSRR